LAEIKKRAQAI